MIRIAIPSDDQTTVAAHFGRASGFLVFHHDGSELRKEFRRLAHGDQTACCEHGDSRHSQLIETIGDCNVVVAAGVGRHMLSALYQAGIDVVISSVTDARRAAELLVSDLLPVESGSGCCQH